jgi:hypothetical protein
MDNFEPLLSTPEERGARARRLLEERNRDPIGFIEAALKVDARAAGFKALYGTLLNPKWQVVVENLFSSPGIRFIHLKRRNALRRYVSERLFLEGGAKHSALGGGGKKRIMIQLDIEDFWKRSAELDQLADRVEALLRGFPVHAVTYESLADDVPAEIAGVCQFLGVDVAAAMIEPALEKVGASDLREVVSNFEELLTDERTRDLVNAK